MAAEVNTTQSDAVALASQALQAENRRRGIIYDRWPFRLDISVEYQDWILILVSVLLLSVWCLPCVCGHMRNPCSRSFTSWVYTRLHVFFCVVTYFNLLVLMFTIGILPDWTVNEFVEYLVRFVTWVLIHLEKLITSSAIIFGFFLLFQFRERLALAAGMEHITVFRWNWRDAIGFFTKKRPIEIFIWKVDGLYSSSSKVMKANDIFVECHMGHNEPMRTRVHNNAGSSAMIKESFQLNIDENAAGTLMTILIKDQSLVTSSELGRLMLSTREICGIEDQTGKRRSSFTYSSQYFVSLDLSPTGKIWIAIAPVEDGDTEQALLRNDEDDLMTC